MKALEFVAIDPGIAMDPTISIIAVELRKDRYHIAGRFPGFLGRVAEHSVTGSLAGVPDDLLDAWAGDLRGFGALVRRHMCDPDGQLRSWRKYNGQKLTQLQADRDYKRETRERKKREAIERKEREETARRERQEGVSTSPPDKPDIPRTVRRQSADSRQTVGTRSDALTETETETETGTTSSFGVGSSADPPPTPPAEEARLRAVLEPFGVATELGNVLAHSQRRGESVVRAMLRLVDPENGMNGPGGRPITVEELAFAIVQLDGADDPGWHGGFANKAVMRFRSMRQAATTPSSQSPDDEWAAWEARVSSAA